MNPEKALTGYPSVDKPWLKFYGSEALSVDFPKMTVYEYLLDRSKDNMDDCAMQYYGKEYTYREMFENIDRIAAALKGSGISKGDRVTICSLTTPDAVFCFYAVAKLGAVANIVEPRTNTDLIVERINATNSKIAIILDIFYYKISGYELNVNKVVVTSLASNMDIVTKIGFMLTKGRKIPKPEYSDTVIRWSDFMKLGDGVPAVETAGYTENTPVAIIYTSGTTGKSKGAQLTHDSLNAIGFQYRFPFPYNRGDSFLDIMPPFIAYGLACGIHMPLTVGLKQIIIPAFSVDEFASYILKYKPNFFLGVPSHFDQLIKDPKMQTADLSFVKVCAMGGDILNPELELEIEKFLEEHHSKSKVFVGYGMTEMSSAATTLSYLTGGKHGSVGIPFHINLVSIFEPGTDKELKYGEEGEICFCGPGMMYGYLNDPEETSKVIMKHSDGNLWVHTQDIGYMDEDGFVYFKDRIKRILIRPDGHNVWPSAIENVIVAHSAVNECAVVGLPNPVGSSGRIPTAFIVKSPDSDMSEETIEKELREISQKKLPERDQALLYYFVDEIPLTPIGKVDYRKLEDGDWEKKEFTL